jgi:hypothetical protein
MKVTITVKDKHEIELNKDKLDSIKKILHGNIEIVYSRVKKAESKKISSLSGLISIGGNSVKDSEKLYE